MLGQVQDCLFRSSALPGLNEKPFLSRDEYNSADFAPGPYLRQKSTGCTPSPVRLLGVTLGHHWRNERLCDFGYRCSLPPWHSHHPARRPHNIRSHKNENFKRNKKAEKWHFRPNFLLNCLTSSLIFYCVFLCFPVFPCVFSLVNPRFVIGYYADRWFHGWIWRNMKLKIDNIPSVCHQLLIMQAVDFIDAYGSRLSSKTLKQSRQTSWWGVLKRHGA